MWFTTTKQTILLLSYARWIQNLDSKKQRKSVISDQTDSWNQGIWNWSGNRLNQVQGNILMSSTIQFTTEPIQECTKWKRTGLKQQQHYSFRTCRKYRFSHLLEEKKKCISSVYSLRTWQLKQATNQKKAHILAFIFSIWMLRLICALRCWNREVPLEDSGMNNESCYSECLLPGDWCPVKIGSVSNGLLAG